MHVNADRPRALTSHEKITEPHAASFHINFRPVAMVHLQQKW